jgi:hypothetical protein
MYDEGIAIGLDFFILVLCEATIKILVNTHIRVLHIRSTYVISNMSIGYCSVE